MRLCCSFSASVRRAGRLAPGRGAWAKSASPAVNAYLNRAKSISLFQIIVTHQLIFTFEYKNYKTKKMKVLIHIVVKILN
jgi:hypothetical protein